MKVSLVLVLASVVLTVAVAASFGPLLVVDHAVANGLHGYALDHPGAVTAMLVWTDVFQPWTFRAILTGVAVCLLSRRRTLPAAWVAVTTILCGAVESGLKAWLGRVRPHWTNPVAEATGGSFPSGHALTSAMACAVLLTLAWPVVGPVARRVLSTVAVAVPVVTGFTRLGLGVHYLSDVVGGWLIAIALVTATTSALRRMSRSATR